ncbi:MAG: PAC2 family protein, partial [Methanomassiliicoccales archaeon]
MDNIKMIVTQMPVLEEPVLVEGLPGVGNVGKLAAEHLVEQLKATKFADIYSKYFPPQVLVDDEGLVRLVSNELFYSKGEGARPDLIILVGDYQGLSPEGQYELSDHVLTVMKGMGVKRVYTLGGYGVGKMLENP